MITLDGIIFTCGNRFGGISVYFRELMRQAVLAGESVEMLVHDRDISVGDVHCAATQLLFREQRAFERYRSLRNLPRGLLHSSYYRTSAQKGVRNVVTVYDFTYERFSSGPRAWLHSFQKRQAILRADAALCISENTRRDLLHFVPEYPPEKSFVTHLAASDQFKPLEATAVTPTERPFVLFVGGRSDYKGFAPAVEALRLSRDLSLVCVGGGPFSAAETALLEQALPGRHRHAGSVNSTLLNELYNSAVCLLYPSLYEGFGIPPLEAMQAGCPFVALNRTSIPEVAGDAGILVNEPDPHSLAAAIGECIDPARRRDLRTRGFAQASKFSWRKTFTDTLPVYQRLLAGQVQ